MRVLTPPSAILLGQGWLLKILYVWIENWNVEPHFHFTYLIEFLKHRWILDRELKKILLLFQSIIAKLQSAFPSQCQRIIKFISRSQTWLRLTRTEILGFTEGKATYIIIRLLEISFWNIYNRRCISIEGTAEYILDWLIFSWDIIIRRQRLKYRGIFQLVYVKFLWDTEP